MRGAVRADVVQRALVAEEDELATGQVRAVVVLTCGRCASLAYAEHLRVIAEFVVHAGVEEIERSFPQPVVAEGLAVAHDAAVELIDLLEASTNHERGQYFAPHTAGEVGDHSLRFQVVITATVEHVS